MNLEELKSAVDFAIENLNGKDAKDVPVLINLSEKSIGSRASTGIKHIGMGFDWEDGQLRIEPALNLVRKGSSMTDTIKVIRTELNGRKVYYCPKCTQKIAKEDVYCRYCCQKLK